MAKSTATRTTTRNRRASASSQTSAVDRVRQYCKAQGFRPIGGKRNVLVQAYYALRELLGQQLQSQAYLSNTQNNGVNWKAFNGGGFDKMIGGSPMKVKTSEQLDAIATNMAEIAGTFLAPRFSKDQSTDECVEALALYNFESIQSRNASRRDSAAFADAVSKAIGDNSFVAQEDDLSDLDDDDDFETIGDADLSSEDDDDDVDDDDVDEEPSDDSESEDDEPEDEEDLDDEE